MFGGPICVLMGLVVFFPFVPVLKCMIPTKSRLFNESVLLIMCYSASLDQILLVV